MDPEKFEKKYGDDGIGIFIGNPGEEAPPDGWSDDPAYRERVTKREDRS